MSKGFFFSLPSVSVQNTLTPIIDAVASSGIDIIYYSAKEFKTSPTYNFRFKPYPENFNGYYSNKIDENTSYFEFGEILLNSAQSLMEFLQEEVETEKPMFILHSHLAVWGKLLAQRHQLPAVSLYTTFVLDKRIMLPFFRKINKGTNSELKYVNEALGFNRKLRKIYTDFELQSQPDIWDIYVNQEELNLSFILNSFQPSRELFDERYQFLGFPTPLTTNVVNEELIYLAMGTILNKQIDFYQLCLEVLREFPIKCVISTGGGKININEEDLPGNVEMVPFLNQLEILKRTTLFITRGGMASVHEAIYSLTPMVVIPIIPEQRLTAEKIHELGLGIHIPYKEVCKETLTTAIQKIRADREKYEKNLTDLIQKIPAIPPEQAALKHIVNYLRK